MPKTASLLSRRVAMQTASAFQLMAAVDGLVSAAMAQSGYDRPGVKMTQVLRSDLQGQSGQVQETIVTRVEFLPGQAAPMHFHPGAQEILYVVEGSVKVEQDGVGANTISTGEAALTPADVPHLVRNESATITARAVVVHSRADKQKPLVVAAAK